MFLDTATVKALPAVRGEFLLALLLTLCLFPSCLVTGPQFSDDPSQLPPAPSPSPFGDYRQYQ